MKQLLPFLLLVFIPFLLEAQAVRKVLVESFTNASCPPCAAQNPAFNNLVQNNADRTVLLKYQVNFPGFDPMYAQNPGEVDTRRSYYSVTSVPNVRLDGIQNAGTSGQVTQAMINTRANQSTPIEMELTHYITEARDSVYIQCTVRNIGDVTFNPGNVVLHTVIVEKRILYPLPPGSTNERDFKSVMRKMLPNPAGTPIDSILPGESLVFNFTEPIPSYFYSVGQLGIVAFVQRTTNRQVYQAEESLPQPVPGNVVDAGLYAAGIGPDGLCNYEATPRVEIVNEGHQMITSMDISYTLNGGEPVVEPWEGELAAGESLTFSFPIVELESGEARFEYAVANVNEDAFDYNELNQLIVRDIYYTLRDNSEGEDLAEDMEEAPIQGIPENTVVVKSRNDHFMVVNRNVFSNVAQQLGGFAASTKSMFTNFYDWNASGAEAHMIFEKIDLSNRDNAFLKFDYAYAQYSNENDRLRISVSTDCGETWTTVWNKAGAQLATRSAVTARFYPTATQWRKDSVALTAFNGLDDVNVRFTVVTAYGNNLFLDNIEVYQLVTSVDEPGRLSGKVRVFPNPASDMTRIAVDLEAASPVNISVFDLSGKLVETIANGNQLGAGSHQFDWAPQAQGVFLVRVATAFGAVTERVTVVR